MNITGSTMLALANASLKEQLAAMTHERDAITKEYDLCRKLLMDRVGDMQDSRKQFAAMTQEIEEQARLLGISGSKEARLIAELAAMTQERDDLLQARAICPECAKKIDEAAGIDLVGLNRQLAASQAYAQRLREALELARNGIQWYMDAFPEVESEADHEEVAKLDEALALPTDDSALMERLKEERERAVREYIEMLCHDEGYWCFVCGRFLPANEEGVIVHDNVPHPEEMTFDEEKRPQ